MHWLFKVYIGIALILIGCVLMAAVPSIEEAGAILAVAGVVWATVAYLMRLFSAPISTIKTSSHVSS